MFAFGRTSKGYYGICEGKLYISTKTPHLFNEKYLVFDGSYSECLLNAVDLLGREVYYGC